MALDRPFAPGAGAGTPSAATPVRSATAAPAPNGSHRLDASEMRRAQASALASVRKIDTGMREFDFQAADFERVRVLIYKHAGISLSAIKQDMVYSRLARRLRAKGLKTFKEYLDTLESGRDESEWESFVNSLTTNLTSFFREAHHFEILSAFMRKQADKPTDKRALKLWCSAASTGEEAYSLAMTACETFNSMSPPVQIVASDLDTNVLSHGQRGVYGADRIERLEPARVQRFFVRGTGVEEGKVRVRPELQRMITFRQVNLLDASYPVQGPFDAIFCRNVMIYFDKQTQYSILERFAPLLRPEGLLFAGHSENFIHAAKLFRSQGRTVYAKADTPASR